LIHREIIIKYALVSSRHFDLIVYLGSTQPFDRGWAASSFMSWLIVMTLLVQRGEHSIELELTFSNHRGYVFHDSRGFEAGDKRELEIVQDFVRRKSRETKLNDRLHVIWFALFGIYSFKFARFAF
jgi:hypothetical protein